MIDFDFSQGPFTGTTGPQAVDEFPDVLTYDDLRGAFWNSPDSVLTFGVDGSGDAVTVDLDSDTPHVLVSAASGAGKSVIAASLATQALVKGASAVFLDVKRISHRWAKNLPQVHYAASVEEIANALVSIAAEVQRRMRIIEEFPGSIKDAPVGPRLVIIAEELNSMMDALKDLEKTLPPRGVYKPSRAFADIMNLGRAARVHVIGFGQYVDAQTVPTRLRESFGYRVLIRHSSNVWNMLAWQCGYCPPAPQQTGRGFVVKGDRAVQTQFLYLPEELAAQLVRDAYDARVRMGLVDTPTRRELRQQRRDAKRELRTLEGR